MRLQKYHGGGGEETIWMFVSVVCVVALALDDLINRLCCNRGGLAI